jgi:hypothetical protein
MTTYLVAWAAVGHMSIDAPSPEEARIAARSRIEEDLDDAGIRATVTTHTAIGS